MLPASKEKISEVVERNSPCVMVERTVDLVPAGVAHVSIVSLSH